MQVFGLAGWSGSGKTTLVVELLPELRRRGYSVSTIKRTHHDVDVDQPGKDSWRHRQAGAGEVMLVSGRRWALMHENAADEDEPPLSELIARMSPVDLLLIEGFKRAPHAKLEIHRPSTGKPLLWRHDPAVVAVASDQPVPTGGLPLLDLNDVSGIAEFILARTGLLAGFAKAAE